MLNVTEKVLEEVSVVYVKSENGPAGATKAFNKLEAKLPSFKGRKFYGLIFGKPPKLEYWASVAVFPEDDPKSFGFATWTIPGGRYVQTLLKDWNENLDKIPKLFGELADKYEIDKMRPSIEFYRSMEELLLRVPIK